MSRSEPNWHDVRWDYGAAAEAVGTMRRAADEIDRLAGERARAALGGLGEWRGAHRQAFDDRLIRADQGDSVLGGDLRRAAADVAQASQRAREEQARRKREREQWERERERDRRRATNA